MTRAWLIFPALVGACGRDVQLGTAADASIPDDVLGTFTAGSYALAVIEPTMVNCDGTLIGMEASFAGITAASQNVVNGAIDLAVVSDTKIRLTGVAITTGFNQPAIDLMLDPQSTEGFPPTIWDTDVSMDFGSGPLSTTQTERFFGIDQATAQHTVMEAVVAMFFMTGDQQGGCTLSWPATLTQQ